MRRSSIAFERVFVPRLEFSRWALGAWLIQHFIATTAIWISGLDTYVKLSGGAMILACAVTAFPRRCRALAVMRNGNWALPCESFEDLQILPGTRFTQWWAILRLGCADGKSVTLRLWRDAWSAGDWRALLITLREYRRPPGD